MENLEEKAIKRAFASFGCDFVPFAPVLQSVKREGKQEKNAKTLKNDNLALGTTTKIINSTNEIAVQGKSSKVLKPQNEYVQKATSLAQNAKTMEELKETIEKFDGCEIKEIATNTVFGDGNYKSDMLLIGEAPGMEEDRSGLPFVGRSGKLLREAFARGGFSVNDFFISNTVFWRPPGNRNPLEEEIEICRPFVKRIIEIMSPKLIVAVGSISLCNLLGEKVSISKFRGTFSDFNLEGKTFKLVGVFHPAFLLRSPKNKKHMWIDILKIREFLSK